MRPVITHSRIGIPMATAAGSRVKVLGIMRIFCFRIAYQRLMSRMKNQSPMTALQGFKKSRPTIAATDSAASFASAPLGLRHFEDINGPFTATPLYDDHRLDGHDSCLSSERTHNKCCKLGSAPSPDPCAARMNIRIDRHLFMFRMGSCSSIYSVSRDLL